MGRKSPLRVVNEAAPFSFDDSAEPASAGVGLVAERAPELTAGQLRRLMISEFRDWLGTRTSRDKRPFQPDTISAYVDAAVALDALMSRKDVEEHFTGCGGRLVRVDRVDRVRANDRLREIHPLPGIWTRCGWTPQ